MRAVIYAAKSTEDLRGSIPDQLRDCRAMAEREGWEVAAEYKDEAASAFHGNRGDGLRQAKEHAARLGGQGGAAVLLAQHSSRFARGAGDSADAAMHLAEVFFEMRRAGVRLRTVEDDAAVANLVMVAVTGDQNHAESLRKSVSVKAGQRRRAEKGDFNGGRLPRGLRYHLEVVEGEVVRSIVHDDDAEVIRRVFRELADGRSQGEVARGLIADGVRGVTQANVSRWSREALYIGMVHLNGETFRGNHAPLIDRETWDAVQARRGRGSKGGRPSKDGHLLVGGMLRCGRCGSAMNAITKRQWGYYACASRRPDRTLRADRFCGMPNQRRDVIDAAVFSYFQEAALDVEATRRAIEQRLAAKASLVAREREQLARDEMRNAAEIERLDEAFGTMPLERYNRLAERAEGGRAELEQRRRHLEAREAECDATAALRDVEGAVEQRLADIRAAIIGQVRGGGDTDGVRRALRETFSGFVLHHLADAADESYPAPSWWEPKLLPVGGIYIEPKPHPHVLTDGREDFPVLERVALDAETDTSAKALKSAIGTALGDSAGED